MKRFLFIDNVVKFVVTLLTKQEDAPQARLNVIWRFRGLVVLQRAKLHCWELGMNWRTGVCCVTCGEGNDEGCLSC